MQKTDRNDLPGKGMRHLMHAILHLLDRYQGSACPSKITSDLAGLGMAVSERTVRSYLNRIRLETLSRKSVSQAGTMSEKERQEILVSRRSDPIIGRIQALISRMDFDPDTGRGKAAVNVSYIPEEKLGDALKILSLALSSPYATSDHVLLRHGGEILGDGEVPEGSIAIGTVCSFTLCRVFLAYGIEVHSRLAGIIDVEQHTPVRFHDCMSYDSSSLSPLEVLIRSGMTDVASVLAAGRGSVLGSFREIPEARTGEARRAMDALSGIGFHRTTLFGEPGRPLLGVPVPEGRVGLIAPAGLNAHAVLHEAGLATSLRSLSVLHEYTDLIPIQSCIEQFSSHPLQASKTNWQGHH